MLHVCVRVCVCVYSNKHACLSANSFAAGSGALGNICHVFIALFWDPVANIFPAKRYFHGLTTKYLAANIFVYTVMSNVQHVWLSMFCSQCSIWSDVNFVQMAFASVMSRADFQKVGQWDVAQIAKTQFWESLRKKYYCTAMGSTVGTYHSIEHNHSDSIGLRSSIKRPVLPLLWANRSIELKCRQWVSFKMVCTLNRAFVHAPTR
jgi:hypothetical protein